MRVPKLSVITAILLAVTIPMAVNAQLSEAEKTSAVKAIAQHIAEKYVDQQTAGQIASHILTENHKGEFRKARDWKEFDKMVTESLQKFSYDRHLYVRNDPETVRQLNNPESTASSEKQMNSDGFNLEKSTGINTSSVVGNNIGYLKLSQININKNNVDKWHEAMRGLQGTDALIIDLRDNKGGGSEIGAVLESYFLPANLPLLEFVSRSGAKNVESTIALGEPAYSKPVYIIINNKTASAAEAFAFVMKKHKRATIVGETSAGAANRNDWIPLDGENYLSISTSATYLPGTDVTWDRKGVKPDIRLKSGDPVQYLTEKIIRN